MWRAVFGLMLAASLVMSFYFFLRVDTVEKDLLLKSGHNTLSLQGAFTETKAKKIIESWTPEQKTTAGNNLKTDFMFMFLGYGLMMLAIACLFPSPFLIGVSVLAVGFDCLENFFYLNMIVTQKYFLAFPAGLFTVAKFFFISLFILSMVVVAYQAVLKQVMRRSG
jgi:hypothetical protein